MVGKDIRFLRAVLKGLTKHFKRCKIIIPTGDLHGPVHVGDREMRKEIKHVGCTAGQQLMQLR